MKTRKHSDFAASEAGQSLLEEHGQLDRLLDRLLNASDGIDSAVLQRTWTEFESRLARHLEHEETHLFPKAEKRQPATVARLRREHAEIRNLVATLGVGADLHTLRRAAAEALVRLLREHANYEERTLYPLVGDRLAPIDERAVR